MYRTHERRAPTRPRVKCSTCGATFVDKFRLRVHMNLHTGERPYACVTCAATFASPSMLWRHERVEHASADCRFPCDVCGRVFVFRSQLKRHLLAHAGDKHKCHVCHKTFASESYLCQHMTTHHDVTCVSCPVCGKSFSDSSRLECHMRVHAGERPYPCEYCDVTFTSQTSRVWHYQQQHQHELSVARFSCTRCDYTTHSDALLKAHERTHASAAKLHLCAQCGYRAKTATRLRRHTAIHDGVYRFQCRVCDKQFRYLSGCKKHLLMHVKSGMDKNDVTAFDIAQGDDALIRAKDVPMLECDVCKHVFATKSMLSRHIARHATRGRRKCRRCPARFSDADAFNEHRAQHAATDYRCTVCGKSWSNSRDLRNHVMTHSSDKPFSCDRCHKRFKSQLGQRRHQERMHPQPTAADPPQPAAPAQ